MKIRIPGLDGLLGYSFAQGIHLWMSTLRYDAHLEDPQADPLLGVGGPKIFVVWHESMLPPIYLRAHCRIAILISRHRDADILASIARFSGFGCVRGSTKKGGSEALRSLAEYSRESHIVFTPDGPLGPRREMAVGPAVLASRTGLPIVPIAFGYTRAWRMKTWDQFNVPKPYSSVKVWLGNPIDVPTGLDRSGIEEARRFAEDELNRCTSLAEGWAAGESAPPTSERVFRGRNRDPIAPQAGSSEIAA